MLLMIAVPAMILLLGLICCIATDQMEDDDDDLSVKSQSSRGRVHRGYTRGTTKSAMSRKLKEDVERKKREEEERIRKEREAEQNAIPVQQLDDVDYGYEENDPEAQPEVIAQNQFADEPENMGASPFPAMESEDEANAGDVVDRQSKGFSIAGAVSAQRKGD